MTSDATINEFAKRMVDLEGECDKPSTQLVLSAKHPLLDLWFAQCINQLKNEKFTACGKVAMDLGEGYFMLEYTNKEGTETKFMIVTHLSELHISNEGTHFQFYKSQKAMQEVLRYCYDL